MNWLPLDIAAIAISQIATGFQEASPEGGEMPVYHIVNQNKMTTWRDLLSWLKPLEIPFDVLPPSEWVARLEALDGEEGKHPARKLLGLWKEAVRD